MTKKDPQFVKSKKEMTKNIITIIEDNNISEAEMKSQIKTLICDKIVDGTKLSDKDRIDIVECGWLCYRLNRDAGRSRVVSYMLAITVIIDAIGFLFFGKKNNLKDLTSLIFETAKRPISYAFLSFGRKTISFFLPSVLTFLGTCFGIPVLLNLGRTIGQAWGMFKFSEPIDSMSKAAGFVIGNNIPYALAGLSLISIANIMRTFFSAVYAVYVAMFNSIRKRTTKVAKKEINQRTVAGIESVNRQHLIQLSRLKEDSNTSSFLSTAGLYAIRIVIFSCISAVLQCAFKKVNLKANAKPSNYSEVVFSTLLTTASLTTAFYKILKKIPNFIYSTVKIFTTNILFPAAKLLINNIVLPFLKRLLTSAAVLIDEAFPIVYNFITNLFKNLKLYLNGLVQKAINSKSIEKLKEKSIKLKTNIINIINNIKLPKSKLTNVTNFIKSIDDKSSSILKVS